MIGEEEGTRMENIQKYIDIALKRDKKRDPTTVPASFSEKQIRQGYFTMEEAKQFGDGEDIKIKMHPPIAKIPSQALPSFSPRSHPELPHNHDFFEITYVYRGTFINRIEGVTIRQTPEQIVLMNLGTKHTPWLEDEDSVVFNILLRKSVVEQTFLQLLQSNRLFFQFFLDSLYGVNTPSSYLTFELTPPLRQVMEALIEEYYEEREFFQEIMVSHLLRLFSEFARIHYAYLPKDRTEEPGPAKIPQVLLYMRQNYAQVDLSSVAEHFHYSPRHLSRLIHEKTGRTFLKWVNTYKLQSACVYLQKSELPINRIVELVGYQDCSYFYKLFKSQMGMTVAEYRRQSRQQEK